MAEHLEHLMRPISASPAVPLFAFFSAGVALGGMAMRRYASTGCVSIGTAWALIVGTSTVVGTAWLITQPTKATLHGGLVWIEVFRFALLAGAGFTVFLSISEPNFGADTARYSHAKVAILAGPLMATLLAAVGMSHPNKPQPAALRLDLVFVSAMSHKIAVSLGAVYCATLAGILFWPSPVDRPIGGTVKKLINWLHGHGVPEWLVGYMQVEFTANILLFVPFGVILTLRLHRTWWWLSVPIGAAASAAIELSQALFLPQRVPAWSDVAANTAGSFIGALLVLFVWSLRRRGVHRDRRPAARRH